jgi:hypothetical protein
MDRRDFLKTAGGAGLGVFALGGGVATAAHHEAGGDDAESSAALAELSKTLTDLEAGFSDPKWRLQGPADVAEGRRVILHTLHHAIEAWLESDRARPAFKRFVTPEKKLLGDNPDAIYFTTPVSEKYEYRVRGNLADATYTSFTVELGTADGKNSTGVGATLNDSQFEAKADGSFELIASAAPRKKNWIRLDPQAGSLTTRHYYERESSIALDRLHQVPITIENLTPPPPATAPSDASIAAGIRRVSNFLRGTVVPPLVDGKLPSFVSNVPNQFPPPMVDEANEEIGFAAVDNVYSMAPFLVKPGEALVIKGRYPKCRFANVVLWNRFLQTLDYTQRRVSLNRKQTRLEADGSFKIVIAHEDPGVPNWLHTEGRMLGTCFWRFQLPEEEIAPLEAKIVPLAEAKSA